MKKTISLAFIGAALLALAACSDDTETKVIDAPSVTLSPTSVTLSAEAVESYTINYTVSNPGEGASVSCTADASWISGIDCSVSGQVRFSVAENASDEMRAATLTLTYSYDDGTVTAKAAIVQYGAGDPVLSVDPNAIVASADGGAYSFGYTIDNPIDGEEIDCSTDVDWISNFDYSTYGTVSFDVAASEDGSLRSAVITVTYAGLEKEVDVVQDRAGETALRVSPSSISAAAEGGTYEFTYTLRFPVDGEGVNITADVDWITGITDDGDGTVTFNVAENTEWGRTGVITVAHADLSETCTVTQKMPDADPSTFVGTYECYGMAYDADGAGYGAYTSWTLKIYENEDGTLTLSGLVPDTEEYYPDSGAYIAKATISGGDVCVAYPQWTGYYTTSGGGPRQTYYYICWIQCTQHSDSDGWYYSTGSGTCTFEFTSGEGIAIGSTWTSDTGLFLGLSSSQTSVSFYSFYDVFAPGMTFTKISDSTDDDTEPSSITPTSLKSLDARPFHTGAKLAK